ncbi:MAG: peptide-methionine (S)-S-oxide reductase MsrA [Gemmatimonadales bacterium]
MSIRLPIPLFVAALAVTVLASRRTAGATAPHPLLDSPSATALAATAGRDSVIFAGGCFWGVEAVFERVKGVIDVTSGYAGGSLNNPSYERVSDGDTGHAESVKIIFDPSVVSYGQLLKVFFSVAHDPTQLNFQGPDHGTQYRSAIWYASAEQQKETAAYIAQLAQAKVFPGKIVTQVSQWQRFWPAEGYHQGYYDLHPNQPYIVYNDRPKVEQLRKQFPTLYHEK